MKKTINTLAVAAIYMAAFVWSASAQNTFSTVSAGNWTPFAAPGSIAAGFGNGFAMTTTIANQLPLPLTLANTMVVVTDSAGVSASAPLFMVNPGQINYLVPANLALGQGTVKVTDGTNTYTGTIELSNVAPAIFAADGSGSGPPAAQVIRVSGGKASLDPAPFNVGVNGSPATPAAISLTPFTDSLYIVLYGTGIAGHTANPVIATIAGNKIPVLYAGPQGQESGLDQINIGPLPQSLAGKGSASLQIIVDGIPANTVTLNFQ